MTASPRNFFVPRRPLNCRSRTLSVYLPKGLSKANEASEAQENEKRHKMRYFSLKRTISFEFPLEVKREC